MGFEYIWTHKEACGYVVRILCNPLCGGALCFVLDFKPVFNHSFTCCTAHWPCAGGSLQSGLNSHFLRTLSRWWRTRFNCDSMSLKLCPVLNWTLLLLVIFDFWVISLRQLLLHRVFSLFVVVLHRKKKIAITSWKMFELVNFPLKHIIMILIIGR